MLFEVHEILKRYYGYDNFRKGQEEVIEGILNGHDTLAVMPTGAGKSICYQIPALIFKGITIVISPLISLMKDQVDSLTGVGIKSTYINSSLTYKEVDERFKGAQIGEYKLIYVAPERLQSEYFLNLVNKLNISMVAVDEAHCVSQWGHDFRPSYAFISPFIEKLDKRPVVAGFTATATCEVKDDIIRLLSLRKPDVYVTGFNRENITFSVLKEQNKRDFILRYVNENSNSSGIIYASTRKEVDNLYEILRKNGYKAGRYHAGMNDEERKKSQEEFIYDDIKIIVATNAFGMGIDKSNVRYVIHYNMPKNIEAYYQEAGRAGRDGEKSECILLFSPQDVMLQKYFINESGVSDDRKICESKKLQQMVDYCHTQKCLRKFILEYFGEENVPDNCQNCSNCNDDREITDITIDAQKIFSCIYRMHERFGTTLIAEVLRGSKNKRIYDLNLDKLSTYGIIKNYTINEIKELVNMLIAEEYLELSEGEYPVVRLKLKAADVLKGKIKVYRKIQKKINKVETDSSLFEVLRNLRRKIAEEKKVPPYIVFADTTLKEMCRNLPKNKQDMLLIKGVGEVKFERYGETFISEIKSYCEKNVE